MGKIQPSGMYGAAPDTLHASFAKPRDRVIDPPHSQVQEWNAEQFVLEGRGPRCAEDGVRGEDTCPVEATEDRLAGVCDRGDVDGSGRRNIGPPREVGRPGSNQDE